ncbi:MAG: ribbon-helix-helix domain-containing protein [Propionibacteriaceae bacterium]|jgi:hypothetical protein|nr:ribbon-helix-helix domain-containing protein [Propionibacteriaceae bacterium]
MSDVFVPLEVPADGVWGTIDGVPITDEVIERLVADAEAGFPGARARPVGRPRELGQEKSVVVQFRLDPDRTRKLDERAAKAHTSRSQIIREAIDHELAIAAA